MKRWTAALLLGAMCLCTMAAGVPRVRALSDRTARLVAEARQRSPTIAHLLDVIEQSDVILQVELAFEPGVPTAVTRLVAAAADVRYVRVTINPAHSFYRRVELLGHELQHVAEIAADVAVRDQAGMRLLFMRIGEEAGARGAFETDAAVEVERQVRADLSGQARTSFRRAPTS